MSEVEQLAWIIQGETGGMFCGMQAMLAVAWIYASAGNTTMYGWKTPSAEALWVAQYWETMADPTNGSYYLVSRHDLRQGRVRAFTTNRGPPEAVFRCRHPAYALYAFRR